MAITNLGFSSGLPLEQLLTDMRKVENRALELVQSRYNQEDQRLSSYGTLKGALENYKAAADTLAKDATFGALKTSSSSDAISATANAKAVAGKYDIDVTNLARSQTLVAAGQADRTTSIGTGGTITFTLGNGDTKTLDLTGKGTSLNDLVKAINADASLGINATIVNDGGDNPHRLLLSTSKTGEDAAIASVSVSDNDDLQSFVGFSGNTTDDTALRQTQAAENATLTINGISVTSQTNQVDDVIEGVQLTLSKEESSTVTLTRDDSVAAKAITSFVNAYNAIQTTIKALTSYDVDTQKGSVLTGDALARRMQTQVRDTLNTFNTSGTIRSLTDLGITTDPTTGQLKVDNDKLNAAIKENPTDVKSLFAGETGLVSRVTKTSSEFLRSDGYFATAQTSGERTLKVLKKQYEATEIRIDDKIAMYRQQFLTLEKTVAQMSSTSSYLTQQLAMLGNLNQNNK